MPGMDLLPGTLDVLVLRGLSWGPKHGYAVARWIEGASRGSLTVLDGALYTALHRMEQRGWIAAEWGDSPTGRRAKFYRLTPVGKKQLASEETGWSAYVQAVGRVLRTTTEPA
jgi:PadR family transcriptional regulator, regulatory protein PadR